MDRVTGLFPLLAVLISAVAAVYPAPLIPFKWAIVPLTVKYFSPASALPGALFSIWHNLSGAALASVWSRTSRPRGQFQE